jgi:hypothetical protein
MTRHTVGAHNQFPRTRKYPWPGLTRSGAVPDMHWYHNLLNSNNKQAESWPMSQPGMQLDTAGIRCVCSAHAHLQMAVVDSRAG